MITIRPATEDDIEILFEIRTSVRENHQSREDLAAIDVTPETVADMLRTDSRAWLAEVDGKPAAFSMARLDDQTIFAMFVRPEYENRGLGRALMQQAEEWLFANGLEEIWLTTGTDPGLRAHGFYRRLGWAKSDSGRSGEYKYIKRAVR